MLCFTVIVTGGVQMLPPLQIAIDPGAGVGDDGLERSSLALRHEILDLEVDAVTYRSTVTPPGAKTSAGIDPGSLIVTLSDSAVLVSVVGVLKSWVSRARGRKITVRFGEHEDSLEINNASQQDVTELLRSWTSRYEQ